ncbi:MAG: TIGR01906 family membrane protein [Dorea sp.]|nr:TIGR01906 family membrane protein [Dorea sp.]
MLLIIFSMLLTSFQLAIYGDPDYGFYEKEYQKYHVTEALSMKLEDVMKVTHYMMDYLIGKEEELSIVTEVEGRTQDFFNDQDRFHMGEVRRLFLGGLRLRNMCTLIALLLIVGLVILKVDWKHLLPKAYFRGLLGLLVVGALLAGAFTVDFTRCFTIFHEIFFDNDLWMFNPSEDYMIRMLPEGFFSDMVRRIGVTFMAMVLALAVIFVIWRKYVNYREK